MFSVLSVLSALHVTHLDSFVDPRDAGKSIYLLIGGLEHFLFFHILGIIPSDYFSEGFKPPTSL